MKILPVLSVLLLAGAGVNSVPPSLLKVLKSSHDLSDVASVHHSAPTSMNPGSTDTYLVIFNGAGNSEFQLIQTAECSEIETDPLWECSQQERWRISKRFEVFVLGNDDIHNWISKDPSKALTPYIDMLESIPDQFSRDYFNAPPSYISIGQDGAQLIYSRYGSGCSTTYGIKTIWTGDHIAMQLDTLDERAFCI